MLSALAVVNVSRAFHEVTAEVTPELKVSPALVPDFLFIASAFPVVDISLFLFSVSLVIVICSHTYRWFIGDAVVNVVINSSCFLFIFIINIVSFHHYYLCHYNHQHHYYYYHCHTSNNNC